MSSTRWWCESSIRLGLIQDCGVFISGVQVTEKRAYTCVCLRVRRPGSALRTPKIEDLCCRPQIFLVMLCSSNALNTDEK